LQTPYASPIFEFRISFFDSRLRARQRFTGACRPISRKKVCRKANEKAASNKSETNPLPNAFFFA